VGIIPEAEFSGVGAGVATPLAALTSCETFLSEVGGVESGFTPPGNEIEAGLVKAFA